MQEAAADASTALFHFIADETTEPTTTAFEAILGTIADIDRAQVLQISMFPTKSDGSVDNFISSSLQWNRVDTL